MNIKTFLLLVFIASLLCATGQKPSIELTFTADNNNQHVPLNSILIENLTQGGDTTLYTPDTVLLLEYSLGINDTEFSGSSFSVSQNYPNPFKDKTSVSIYIPERGTVFIIVSDIMGRALFHLDKQLNRGNHSFTFYSGNEAVYFLTARVDHQTQTIKMFNSGACSTGNCKLEYNGQQTRFDEYKSEKNLNSFVFDLGDMLKFTASTDLGERILTSSPIGDQTHHFHYTGNPCPSTPTITDIDGNIYNTVQIGDQCWMIENLKTTTYRNGTLIPNVIVDDEWDQLLTGAYVWYDNDISWKEHYGALYNWYTTVDPNGLCPLGWHVPTNDEWTALTDYIGGTGSPHGNELKSCRQVNSPLGGGCNTSEHPRWKEDVYYGNYGTDDYGFSGLPCGNRFGNGSFDYIGYYGYWWTSTEYSSSFAWFRGLNFYYGYVYEGYFNKRNGFSVRCIRN